MAKIIAAIVLGGAGHDQTEEDLQPALAQAGVRVFSPGRDGIPAYVAGDYEVDAASLVKYAMNAVAVGADEVEIVGIGHSFGTHKICTTIGRLYQEDSLLFDYVCLIDPVSYRPVWAGSITIDAPRPSKGPFEVFYRKHGRCPPNARIVDQAGNVLASPKGPNAGIINGDHSSICHDPDWIAGLVDRIASLAG